MKRALILSIIDPNLGGVLVVGPKGSGKTTVIRSLESILPFKEVVDRKKVENGEQFEPRKSRMELVECPVGVTEEGLIGSIDIEKAFKKGERAFTPGILGRANGNLLYIDEVNLLPDNIINEILDPAASGWSRVKREGFNLEYPSKFTLLASMNPEEGELRPQILDRFALRVEMEKINDGEMRQQIIRNNIMYEDNPVEFNAKFQDSHDALRQSIEKAKSSLETVKVSEELLEAVAQACSRLEVEGLRSDLSVMRASRALAALEEKSEVTLDEIYRTFDLAVSHRIKNKPKTRDIILRTLTEEFSKTKYVDPEDSRLNWMDQLPDPSTRQPKRRTRKRRILPKRLEMLLSLTMLFALLFSFSVAATAVSFLFRSIVFGVPIETISESITLNSVLLNMIFISALFIILSLFTSRMPSRQKYLYLFTGGDQETQIVVQQSPPLPEDRKNKTYEREPFETLNIPLYATLRKLYRTMVEKGVKLMEPFSKGEERAYQFSFYKKRDPRMRRLLSKSSSTVSRSMRGRYISYAFPKGKPWDIAVGPTIRAAAPHQAMRKRNGLALDVKLDDIRVKVRESHSPLSVVILLDLSESMVASLVNVRNAIMSMRDIVFHRRDRLGLIVFKGLNAMTLQQPTPNLNMLVDKLSGLGASDFTPLASGMYEALRVLRNERNRNKETVPVLVLITDGIANIPLETPLPQSSRGSFMNTAQADVFDVAYLLKKEGIITVVINPNHIPGEKVAPYSYREEIQVKSGKRWLDPTSLLLDIPRITGGYYYGIGRGGDLKEVMLTEALSVLGRRAS